MRYFKWLFGIDFNNRIKRGRALVKYVVEVPYREMKSRRVHEIKTRGNAIYMAKYDEVALYRGQAEQNTSGTEYGAYQLFQGQDQELHIVVVRQRPA